MLHYEPCAYNIACDVHRLYVVLDYVCRKQGVSPRINVIETTRGIERTVGRTTLVMSIYTIGITPRR